MFPEQIVELFFQDESSVFLYLCLYMESLVGTITMPVELGKGRQTPDDRVGDISIRSNGPDYFVEAGPLLTDIGPPDFIRQFGRCHRESRVKRTSEQ